MSEKESLEKVNAFRKTTLMGALGMAFTVIRPGHIEATMPVDERTHQPTVS